MNSTGHQHERRVLGPPTCRHCEIVLCHALHDPTHIACMLPDRHQGKHKNPWAKMTWNELESTRTDNTEAWRQFIEHEKLSRGRIR